jgi:hypothetical protein
LSCEELTIHHIGGVTALVSCHREVMARQPISRWQEKPLKAADFLGLRVSPRLQKSTNNIPNQFRQRDALNDLPAMHIWLENLKAARII